MSSRRRFLVPRWGRGLKIAQLQHRGVGDQLVYDRACVAPGPTVNGHASLLTAPLAHVIRNVPGSRLQLDSETGAAFRAVLRPDPSAMQLNDLLGQSEPNAGAAVAAGRRPVH